MNNLLPVTSKAIAYGGDDVIVPSPLAGEGPAKPGMRGGSASQIRQLCSRTAPHPALRATFSRYGEKEELRGDFHMQLPCRDKGEKIPKG